MPDKDPVLLSKLDGRILLLTLNRPDARNALSRELRTAFREAILEADENPDISLVAIIGAGITGALVARELVGLPLCVLDRLLCALRLRLFELALRLPKPVRCRLRLCLRLGIACRCPAKSVGGFACRPRGFANLGSLLFA